MSLQDHGVLFSGINPGRHADTPRFRHGFVLAARRLA